MNRKKKKKKMSLLKKGSIDKVRRTTEEKGPLVTSHVILLK